MPNPAKDWPRYRPERKLLSAASLRRITSLRMNLRKNPEVNLPTVQTLPKRVLALPIGLTQALHAIRGISTTRKVTVAIAHTLASPSRVEATLTDTTHKVLPVCTHWAVALIFSPLAGAR